MINRSVSGAMAQQIIRVNAPVDTVDDLKRQLLAAQREIARLAAELSAALTENIRLHKEADKLNAARLTTRAKLPAGESTVMTQTEAARYLSKIAGREIKQYQIHRWMKAGHFQTVNVPGKAALHVMSDSLYVPPPGRAGRRKGDSNGK